MMATTTTGAVNEAFYFIAAFAFLLFFGIVFFMIYFAVRYRRSRSPVATEIHGNNMLEVVWVVLPTLLALAMFTYGLTGYRFLRTAPAGALNVLVHSRQWSWLFEYPDGTRSPDLVVPSGRNVQLTLTSDDVIHAFYLPALHVQVDTVPGMQTRAWFKAPETGSYDILCAQYCGEKHSAMLAKLYVLAPDRYAAWVGGGIVVVDGIPLPLVKATGTQLLLQRGCLSCHSIDGGRMSGPTFKGLFKSIIKVRTAGKERQLIVSEDYLRRSIVDPGADIVDGFTNVMPQGKNVFTEAELDEAVRAIEDLK